LGTWSAAIFGNDTSCEVKEHFFEQYNLGKEPQDIRKELLALYNMDDVEERFNVLFALAHCLWKTKELDDDFHAEIKKIVSSGDDLAVCRGLGADAKFRREREKALAKLLSDIETPRETAKKRVKPPVPVESVYRNGCCLAFQYEDGKWGAAITVAGEFYKRRAIIHFALTDIKQNTVPAMDDIRAAHLIDDWFDRSKKDFFHHKLSLYGPHFIGSKEIARLNTYNETFFTIIGYLPEWKDAYGGGSAGREPYKQESREKFAAIVRLAFINRFIDGKRTIETVDEFNRIFSDS